MWILTHNGELANTDRMSRIFINDRKAEGYHDKDFDILAETDTMVRLGRYPDMEKAKRVIGYIMEALEDGCATYEMIPADEVETKADVTAAAIKSFERLLEEAKAISLQFDLIKARLQHVGGQEDDEEGIPF